MVATLGLLRRPLAALPGPQDGISMLSGTMPAVSTWPPCVAQKAGKGHRQARRDRKRTRRPFAI